MLRSEPGEHGARGGVPMRRLHLPSSKPGRQPLSIPCSDHWHLTPRAATGSARSTGKHPPCAGWPEANTPCQGPLHPRPPVPLSAPLSSLPLVSPLPLALPFPLSSSSPSCLLYFLVGGASEARMLIHLGTAHFMRGNADSDPAAVSASVFAAPPPTVGWALAPDSLSRPWPCLFLLTEQDKKLVR